MTLLIVYGVIAVTVLAAFVYLLWPRKTKRRQSEERSETDLDSDV